MATTDISKLINTYRECARNLWNVYFSDRKDIGGSLDAFGQSREILFDTLVLNELSQGDEYVDPHTLRVVPQRSLILIQRLSEPGQAGYWDQEKDMVVGPEDIELGFLDYFDFYQIPIQDFRYYRCRVLSFPTHRNYEGREALLEVLDAKVFYNEPARKQ